ncbi:hypothetical protein DV736_g6406, partial [Chaetothyriales sp. CBS 134916]
MAAAVPVSLGTSNLRGSARQTRTNPTRTSKTVATVLRQNSLVSNTGGATQGASEQHGFYPAIQHFTDAVAALPRDYRRHVSLLKEVDAKAFNLETDLQQLLTQCAAYTSPLGAPPAQQTDEAHAPSASDSTAAVPHDNDSYSSNPSTTAASATRRRQAFHNLRATLMQIMVTMDEKNHVINNANEELSRHLRRFHSIWPHMADEISEEAMFGSVKHWAYTDTNPTKKNTATTRREAAANVGLLHESDIAQRSESRREAVAAKSKRNLARIEAGFAEINHNSKKAAAADKRRAADAEDLPGLGITGPFRGKKAKLVSAAVDKATNAVLGSGALSREASQQDGGKKRKAPAAMSAMARKRLNANHDSPKLPPAALTGALSKEPYKRSPALAAARPATSRGRQNSVQTNDNNSRGRPSSASVRNGISTGTLEQHGAVVTATGKTGNDAKNTTKESTVSKGIEAETPNSANSDIPTQGPASLERITSKQGSTKDLDDSAKPVDSPRLGGAVSTSRGRASKISTPVIGAFADAESSSTAENGNGKSKRPARPRVKDHGLHDSLSPKGLPLKRSHKKGASMASQPSQQTNQRVKPEAENITTEEYSEEPIDDLLEDEKYCYCNGPSYGEMIACDNPKCPGEWFHLECIGLKNAPKSEKWFCEDWSFILGSPQEQAPFCAQMARELGTSDPGGGCVVISVDYRLGPYAQYPAANEDAEDILRAVLEPATLPGKILLDAIRQKVSKQFGRTDRVNLDTNRIALSGFSSGGNIALGLAFSVQNDPTIHRDWRSVIPQHYPRGIPLVLFYPSLDSRLLPDERPRPPGLEPPTGFFTRLKIESELMPKYMPAWQRAHPRASPGLAPLEGLHPQARIMLVLPELDSLSDQSMAWIEKLAQEGRGADLEVLQVPGVMHGWTQFPDSWLKSDDDRAKKYMVFEAARDFVQQVWKGAITAAAAAALSPMEQNPFRHFHTQVEALCKLNFMKSLQRADPDHRLYRAMETLRRATVETARETGWRGPDAATTYSPYGSSPRTSYGGFSSGRADHRPGTPDLSTSGLRSGSQYPSPPSTPNGDPLSSRGSYSELSNQIYTYANRLEKCQRDLRAEKQAHLETKNELHDSQEKNTRLQSDANQLQQLNADAKQTIKNLNKSMEDVHKEAVTLCKEQKNYLDAAKHFLMLSDLKLHEAAAFREYNDFEAANKAENTALNFQQQRGEMLGLDGEHANAEIVFQGILKRREHLFGPNHLKWYKESRDTKLSLARALRKQHDVDKTKEAENLYKKHSSLTGIELRDEKSREWAFCNALGLTGALYERQAYRNAKHNLTLIWENLSNVPASYTSELDTEVLKILNLLRCRVDMGHREHLLDALQVICKPHPAEVSSQLLPCYVELGRLLSESTANSGSHNYHNQALSYLRDAWLYQDRLSVEQGRNTLWSIALVYALLGNWED